MTEFEQTKELAEQGDADAQYNLAVMYLQGVDVTQDHAEAIWWLTNAAEQGHAHAQFWVDNLKNGWRVKND